MLKNISKLGKQLQKNEQQSIVGGKVKGPSGGDPIEEPCVLNVYNGMGWDVCNPRIHKNCCPDLP